MKKNSFSRIWQIGGLKFMLLALALGSVAISLAHQVRDLAPEPMLLGKLQEAVA